MLRVVPFEQRTLGIGVHWTFLRLLGMFFYTTIISFFVSNYSKTELCLLEQIPICIRPLMAQLVKD